MKKQLKSEKNDTLEYMIKNGSVEDIQMAAEIIKNNKEYQNQWYDINSLIDKSVIRYSELYSNDGKHDKVYIVAQYPDRRIRCFWGKRGGKIRSTKHNYIYPYHAVVGKKINEGYKLINSVEFNDRFLL